MKIGVDVDDVLAAFIPEFVGIANELYDIPLDTVPVDWEFSNFNLTPDQMSVIWRKIRKTTNFWKNLSAKSDSNLLPQAEQDGHEVYYITSRIPTIGESIKDQTCEWLEEKMQVKHPVVIVSSAKGMLANALNLDAFLDDRDKNCIEVMKHVPTCKVFIKDAGHNQGFTLCPRVKNYNEFYLAITAVPTAAASGV